jgi:enoyl-CoA hydratase/carnithine racemase
MSDAPLIDLARHDAVAVISLRRPSRRNAVNAAMAGQLRQALADIGADPAVRAAILTGDAACFCAGMDLAAFLDGQGQEINSGAGRFAGVAAHSLDIPLVAAVEGPVLAGGFELALACDMIVAGQDAFFGLPEVRVGLFPAAGGAFRLMRVLPPNLAMEMLCAGRRLTADEGRRFGLVNRLAPSGAALAAALELAREIAAMAPLGVRAGLRLARAARDADADRLWAENDVLWAKIMASADAAEGPRAFLEKRPPVWTGA